MKLKKSFKTSKNGKNILEETAAEITKNIYEEFTQKNSEKFQKISGFPFEISDRIPEAIDAEISKGFTENLPEKLLIEKMDKTVANKINWFKNSANQMKKANIFLHKFKNTVPTVLRQ